MIDRILINREECEVRVAFLEEQTLVEIHTEKFDEQSIVNNIYRGRVQDVVPGLQAAFVDVGLERNMFLHFMDIREESKVLGSTGQKDAMREAASKPVAGRIERRGRRPRMDPKVQGESPVKKGDEIIVQVVKDEIGGKAPRVTTNLALAGRYLVMLPFPSQEGGVSRKIAIGPDRARLKKILASLKNPDHGFIVRTAGLDQSEEAIHKDADSLEKLWDTILDKYRSLQAPGLIHNDHDLISRLVRDAIPSDFKEIVCDDPMDAEEVRRQLEEHLPGRSKRVTVYEGLENIFVAYGAEQQLEKVMAFKIWLKSGGYLIIDENEALTAIDVNTGRFTGKKDQEKTSLKTNLEACEVLAQAIRTRDIGGIIVIDFIDMQTRAHQEKVNEELRRQLRRDRAKLAIGKIGDFGLMMLTRKRQRMSLQKQMHDDCPYCQSTGYVLKPDEVFRRIKYDIKKIVAGDPSIAAITISVHPRMAELLRLRYRNFVHRAKQLYNLDLNFHEDPVYHLEDYRLTPLLRPEGVSVPLPPVRIAPEARIAPIEEMTADYVGAVAELPTIPHFEDLVSEAPPEVVEAAPAKPQAEAAPEEKTEAPPAAKAETAEEAQRRKHRESSAERRARRRRKRHQGTEQEAPTARPPSSSAKQQQAPAPEPAAQNAAPAQTTPAEEDTEPRKRTRRGSRGGRSRRRREGEVEQQPEVASKEATAPPIQASNGHAPPEAPAPAPPTPAQPLPPLKLKPKRSAHDLLLADVLDEVFQQVSSARTHPTEAKPEEKKEETPAPAEEKPKRRAAAKRATVSTGKTTTTARKTTKKATTAKNKDGQESAPAAKTKKAATAKKTETAAKKPAAKKTEKKTASAAKNTKNTESARAATTTKRTKKTAATKKSTA